MLEVPEYEFFWQKMLNSPENKLVPVHYVFMEVYMSNEFKCSPKIYGARFRSPVI